MMMTRFLPAAACAAGVLLSSAWAMAQTAPLRSETRPVAVDSGLIGSPAAGEAPQVVWSEVVAADGAPWIRLKFDEVTLAGDEEAGTAAFLRITSFDDVAVQTMNARHVGEWRNTSAYFNGDAVLLEVLAFPRTGASLVRMSEVTAGLPPVEPDSICGPTDGRTPSTDVRAARLMPIGCSGWIINDCNHCFLTAGHCTSPMDTAQFNVPLSTAAGVPRHPGPEDQYAVDTASMQSNGGQGEGDDWAYFGVHPNSTTGLTPFQAQGDAFDIAAAAPSVGSPAQSIRITGYGLTDFSVPREWNQAQKTHAGPYDLKDGTTVRYRTDTTNGNSGSPVIDETTGLAIGIHTHGGCTTRGGSNAGTAIEHPSLQAALAAPQGVCCAKNAVITNFGAGVGTGTAFGSGSSTGYKAFGFTMEGDYTLDGVVLSMNFADPSPDVNVSLWSGSSLPQTHLITLRNPRGLAGAGEFRFTPGSPFTLEEGENYWVRVAAGTPGSGPSFTWDGTNPSTDPTGPGASPVGYIFDGSPSTFRNRLEVQGAPDYGPSLTTTFEGGNGHNGAMFDLTAKTPLRITGFDYNERSGGPGSVVEVYYVSNHTTYVGKETTPRSWTLLGTEAVPSPAPTGSPTHVDIGGLEIDAGDTVGIYFTIQTGSISYTNGPLGAFENADLRFEDRGVGVVYPFSSTFSPRIWNGTVYYEVLGSVCYADCDESGQLDFFDFLCFQNEFAAGAKYADCDGSGGLDFFDFLCFQNEFAAGCP